MRYRLVVLGDVQQVGFREYVKKCAQKMRIKGTVKNQDDGSVEIYCEIDESALERFREMISAASMAKVEHIEVYSEESEQYGKPETDFSRFRVIRDEDEIAETLSVMTSAGLALLEKQDKMIELQGITIEKIDGVANKIDGVANKIDGVANKIDGVANKIDGVANKIDGLSGKIDAMHQDMNERFDRMEVKYGAISDTIRLFLEEFRAFNAKLDEHNRKLDLILEKLVAMERE